MNRRNVGYPLDCDTYAAHTNAAPPSPGRVYIRGDTGRRRIRATRASEKRYVRFRRKPEASTGLRARVQLLPDEADCEDYEDDDNSAASRRELAPA